MINDTGYASNMKNNRNSVEKEIAHRYCTARKTAAISNALVLNTTPYSVSLIVKAFWIERDSVPSIFFLVFLFTKQEMDVCLGLHMAANMLTKCNLAWRGWWSSNPLSKKERDGGPLLNALQAHSVERKMLLWIAVEISYRQPSVLYTQSVCFSFSSSGLTFTKIMNLHIRSLTTWTYGENGNVMCIWSNQTNTDMLTIY